MANFDDLEGETKILMILIEKFKNFDRSNKNFRKSEGLMRVYKKK